MALDQPVKDFITAGWLQGFSAGQLRQKIWEQFHVATTRNAVIGLITRSGVKRPPVVRSSTTIRTDPDRPARPEQTYAKKQPRVKSYPQLQRKPYKLGAGPLLGACQWPDGDGPFVFCGAAREEDSSYCAEHYRRSVRRYGE